MLSSGFPGLVWGEGNRSQHAGHGKVAIRQGGKHEQAVMGPHLQSKSIVTPLVNPPSYPGREAVVELLKEGLQALVAPVEVDPLGDREAHDGVVAVQVWGVVWGASVEVRRVSNWD